MEIKKITTVVPVLPSNNIARDIVWYRDYLGFQKVFGDDHYIGLRRFTAEIHLQWHAGTAEDPIIGSMVKFFVTDLAPYADELLTRTAITKDQIRKNTPWNTHEIGLYDPNKNAIFFVENIN